MNDQYTPLLVYCNVIAYVCLPASVVQEPRPGCDAIGWQSRVHVARQCRTRLAVSCQVSEKWRRMVITGRLLHVVASCHACLPDCGAVYELWPRG
jgi:hypothetical protein